MMSDSTLDDSPSNFIIVHKLRNFSWSPEETVLCRDRAKASGITLVSTKESSS